MPVRPPAALGKGLWIWLFLMLCVALFWSPLILLVRFAQTNETFGHVLLVPFISLFLVLREKRRIFQQVGNSWGPAAAVLMAGVLLYTFSFLGGGALSAEDSLGLAIVALVLFVWAGFLAYFGASAFRSGLFAMLFLLLMVPPPSSLVERLITWLQTESADLTYWMFRLTGTPVFRQGFVLTVPGAAIEVAKECSGIRSSLAMLITCLLAGALFLRRAWTRMALLLAAVPMLVLKNGIRITTLTLLAIHVDPGFLHGDLHHKGGVFFFILGLLILWPVLRWLQVAEARSVAMSVKPSLGGQADLAGSSD